MSFFTNEGLNVDGFILTPDTPIEVIKELGDKVTIESNSADNSTHISFNKQMFDNGMRFRVEVFKSDSISPDYIKIVPFKATDDETGEQLYERCRKWLEVVCNREVPDNEYESISFAFEKFIVCLWTQTRENGTKKCRSIRIYTRSVV